MKQMYLGNLIYANFDDHALMIRKESLNGPMYAITLDIEGMNKLKIFLDAVMEFLAEEEERWEHG